jgi:hypothetical protein
MFNLSAGRQIQRFAPWIQTPPPCKVCAHKFFWANTGLICMYALYVLRFPFRTATGAPAHSHPTTPTYIIFSIVRYAQIGKYSNSRRLKMYFKLNTRVQRCQAESFSPLNSNMSSLWDRGEEVENSVSSRKYLSNALMKRLPCISLQKKFQVPTGIH